MKWIIDLFSSSLGRKVVMALTGLFIILFLVVHLIGNLQLLKGDGGEAFNVYAYFMTNNPLIKTIAYVNYAFFLIHIVWAIILTKKNREARGTVGYAIPNTKGIWSSRNMGILGTIILAFLIIHMRQFWGEMHFGSMPMKTYGDQEVKDLYTVVAAVFAEWWYVAIYTLSMLAIAFHLWHGFESAFQTLGLNHLKYNPVIRFVGKAFSIVVPALFALIPIMMFFV
jgi:succinate dehydrogenase / fumarate reductase, cytochrome b subunit